jgi:DNA-binding transcriptional ArsR family regulator
VSEPPVNQIRDPRALRALAHPVRIRLLEELMLGGAATATELSERVGESPANCSWHLRHLARYGFVEETGEGSGRQRPWRTVVRQNRWGEGEEDPELEMAGLAAGEFLAEREYQALRAWIAARHLEPQVWRDAVNLVQAIAWLTAEELAQVRQEFLPILYRYTDRITDPDNRPPGARPIRFFMWGVPARPGAEPEEAS